MAPLLRLKTFGGLGIHREGTPPEGAGAQRRRLALLALLAAAGERGMSREKLLGFLWAESDLERARKNLAQAVYALRRDLGSEDLVLGTTDLRLNPDCMTSDLADFQRAIAEDRPEDAVALYQGPFLDGIYLDEAPEFEQWAEHERAHLAHQYASALEQVALQAEERGDAREAVGYWRRLANADPLNAKVALGLMRSLVRAGDRGAALQHFRVYEMLLRQELDLSPDAAVRAFAEELRRNQETERPAPDRTAARQASQPLPPTPPGNIPVTTSPGTPAYARPAPTAEPPLRRMISGMTDEYARPRPLPERAPPDVGPVSRAGAPPAGRRPLLARRSTRYGIAIGFGLGLVALAVVLLLSRGGRSYGAGARAAPVIAVGRIEDYTKSREGLTRPLADMLATDLARSRDIQVISTARMYEVLAQGGPLADSAAALMRAARAAGASQLLDGALYDRPGGRYRLDLRRTNLVTGNLIESYSAEGEDLFALVTDARKGITRSTDSAAASTLAEVTTQSVVAYRLYEEGLRAMYSGDAATARRLLGQALEEDSTFAMAAYRLAEAGGSFNDQGLIKGLERAVQLAKRASDRERLTILAGWANAVDDPSRIAIAETLTVRYPNEPEGYLWLARGRIWGGDFAGAIPPLRRVIVMDSLALRVDPGAAGAPIRCHACEAFMALIGDYQMMDSLPASERTAREWTRAQPKNPDAWGQVSWVLMLEGRPTEALTADQQVVALAPQYTREMFRAQLALRMGDFPAFEAYYAPLQNGPAAAEGYKWMSIGKRNQGRPHEALAPAQALRRTERVARRDAAPYNALFEAQVWFDLGEFRHAAALFDSISRAPRDSTPSQLARNLVWTQTLRATALAAAGDTTLLRAIADSVERWGRMSAYGRDQRLHHHIRGLLLTARGQPEEGVSEFRQAVFSPVTGYTRTNVELAKLLLRLGRPREAAYWAEAGLRGNLDANNTYVTQTELAELAAAAWDAAGVKDSASVRYRQVVNNWRDAEPAFNPRLERARLRLAMLSAPR
jgi:DNA-binding SARP family transcriptional activator/TolB-like protein